MRASPDERKSLLLTEYVEGRKTLLAAAGQIPQVAQDQVFLGTWSIRDILAHLIGWDDSNLEAIQAISAGRSPAFYQWIDRDWQTYNARLVNEYKKGTISDLVRAAEVSQENLFNRLVSLQEKDLFRDFGVRYRGYKVTIARLIEAETKDEKIHLEQVRGFVKTIQAIEKPSVEE